MPEQRFVETHGVRLHVLQDGPEDGHVVILLHGFPEFSYGWRKQIPYLAAAGYRVWAPDQRGYNLSDKPDGIAAYALDELAADVVGLMDAACCDRAFLVGHDWGAAVAWWVAQTHPERVSKLVVINVPHPAVMLTHLRGSLAQLLKSWYILFFQLPWLPEWAMSLGNWRFGTSALTASARPGTFSERDLDAYRHAWSQPKAMRSMIHWYRGLIRKPPAMPARPRIQVPTLLIWGVDDVALDMAMAQPSIDLCDDGRLVFFEEASHWVHHEEPERVNELIGAFLAAESRSPAA